MFKAKYKKVIELSLIKKEQKLHQKVESNA